MRSKLFVPGSRPELFEKAMKGEADALSFDLEDAVDEKRKDFARGEVARFLRSLPPNCGKTIIVRVNALDTPHFEADLAAVVGPGLDIVNLPMAESADVPTEVAAGDLTVEPLGIDRYNPAMIQAIQLQIRIAAGEADVWAYDGAWADIKDPEGYRREAEAARRLGYVGKSAIHPTQVPIANEVFRPTDDEG